MLQRLLLVVACLVPQDWNAVGADLLDRYSETDWQAIEEVEARLGSALLAQEPVPYLPAMCIARAFYRVNRHAESLPYFEAGLLQSFKPPNFQEYATASWYARRTARGEELLAALEAKGTVPPRQLERARTIWTFFHDVHAGDDAFLAGDREAAHALYVRAREAFDTLETRLADQGAFWQGFRTHAGEYTYFHLYDLPDGYLRRALLHRTFLGRKLAMSAEPPPRRKPVTLRIAALVIRETDLEIEIGERTVRESQTLGDADLAGYHDAWTLAMESVRHDSDGRLAVETEWIELEGVTLRGLRQDVWGGSIPRRQLDPAQLDPPQEERFAELVEEFDGVVFVWHRGRSARTYGGGPLALPGPRGPLRERLVVRSVPLESSTCVHELLHGVERRLEMENVHGPRQPWSKVKSPVELEEEADWYVHLLRSVRTRDWKKARFVR